MPEKEMSYSLIGQSFLEKETGQRIIEVLLILQHLEQQLWEDRKRGGAGGGLDKSTQIAGHPPATASVNAKYGIFEMAKEKEAAKDATAASHPRESSMVTVIEPTNTTPFAHR